VAFEIFIALTAGTLYGLLVGVIPAAGATTGLVAALSFLPFFVDTPYVGVVFLMATVAASTTGDTFAGVLLGIPGANSAAATMVDGFPLSLKGRATYAISAAVTTSTLNALLWGALTFLLLPYYYPLLTMLGIPEIWAFIVLALATVSFVSTKRWLRSLIAVAFGLYLGMVGIDPNTNVERFTFGWYYLADSIQLLPLVAGLFAIPELLDGLRQRRATAKVTASDFRAQTVEGIVVVGHNRWTALRGGFIGAFIGLLPGLGGAMADWLAYASTVAANPKETFGTGNIKGVIGPEGANNAQKATSMIPTVLFGIPGAPFAAVLIGLFSYLNFEMGTTDLASDKQFFYSMTLGFMGATVLVAILCLSLSRYIGMVTLVPYKFYFPVILSIIVWSCVQYTGGWEDYAILALCSALGLFCKKFKFSRPALLLAYMLSGKVEAYTIQMTAIYGPAELLTRPIFLTLIAVILVILVWSFRRENQFGYE
jgi:TctA family transporter